MNRAHILRQVLCLAYLVTPFATIARANSYSTNFAAAENPLSEGGSWINGKATGIDWADVATAGGLAHGTESGAGGYDDSTAILAGVWGPNQTAQAVVHSVNQTGSVYEEVELRLRSSVSAHSNTGYEINFRCIYQGGYVQIVRWNGPLGDYTYITQGPNSNYHGIKEGDIVSASISGNLIIGYVNGVEVIRGSDSTFSAGSPGIGFYLQDGSSSLNTNFGFTSFSCTDGVSSTPTPPSSLKISGLFPEVDSVGCLASSRSGLQCVTPCVFRRMPGIADKSKIECVHTSGNHSSG